MRGPWAELKRRRALRAHAEEFRAYIPFMTEHSRDVIAQVLHENRKDFTAEDDAGHAATLYGRGFVVVCARQGQTVDLMDVPFRVPDHIWDVAVANKEKFPFTPDSSGGDAWRVHWMPR